MGSQTFSLSWARFLVDMIPNYETERVSPLNQRRRAMVIRMYELFVRNGDSMESSTGSKLSVYVEYYNEPTSAWVREIFPDIQQLYKELSSYYVSGFFYELLIQKLVSVKFADDLLDMLLVYDEESLINE